MDVARMWRSRSIGILVVLAVLGAASPGLAVTPRIAFSRGGDLFTIVPDGSGLRRITDEAAREHTPAWSPDRQRIAFISWDRAIVVVNADGERRRTLLRVPSRYDSVDSLAWSPDGQRIALSTTRTSGSRAETRDCGQIWWMWADGRNAVACPGPDLSHGPGLVARRPLDRLPGLAADVPHLRRAVGDPP